MFNRWNRGGSILYSERMHPKFTLQDDSPSIRLSKKKKKKLKALRQETGDACENQLISSHYFADHLKQRCTQNSERLLRTPVDEKKSGRDKSHAVKRTLFL